MKTILVCLALCCALAIAQQPQPTPVVAGGGLPDCVRSVTTNCHPVANGSGNVTIGNTVPAGAPAGTIGTNVLYSPNAALNVKAFGAKGNARMVADAAITAASSTLTSATAAFTSADTGKLVSIAMGPNAVTTGTYTSGITTTGSAGQTCLLTFAGGAAATVYLSGTNAIAGSSTLYFTAYGTGYASTPTTATVAAGTASACSGTATVVTTMHPLSVLTTATYSNATTITLAAAATNTVSSAFMSIATDDTTAIQNAIDQAATSSGSVYFPAAYYGVRGLTISSPVTLFGDGITTTPSGSGETTIIAPYLLGSVLWMMQANTDAVQTTVSQNGVGFHDLGVVFDPANAFLTTGHGFDAAVTGDAWGLHNAQWVNLIVWGVDGNHYAYELTNANYWGGTKLYSYGGGGLQLRSTSGAPCCSGNATVTEVFAAKYVGGSSNGIDVTSAGSNAENLIAFVRPEVNINLSATAVGYPWAPAQNTTYGLTMNIPSNIADITVLSPDLENGNSVFPWGGSFVLLNVTPNVISRSYIPVLGQVSPSTLVGQLTLTDYPRVSFTTFDQGIVSCGYLTSTVGLTGSGCLFGHPGVANDAVVLSNAGGKLYLNHLTNTANNAFAVLDPGGTAAFYTPISAYAGTFSGDLHLSATTTPTASSCGSGTAAGNDNAFQVTGISGATSCTVTFVNALQQGFCTANGAVGLVTEPTGTHKSSIVFGITGSETTITALCF